MLDANLILRSSTLGSLTATETTAGIAIKATPQSGLAARVIVPKKSVGDTVRVKIQHSTDDSTYSDLVSFDTVASVTQADTSSAEYDRRFATMYKYVRAELTVAGTSPDFGAVTVAIGDGDAWNTIPLGLPTAVPATSLN